MRKVKSLVRRILGKPSRPPLTIDTVSSTLEGFCVIGWYLSEQVSKVELFDDQNNKLPGTLTPIERADVVAVTGQAAQGFQLICSTELSLDRISLTATLTAGGQQSLPLSLTGTTVQAAATAGPVKSTSDGKLKGSCEYAIYSDQYIYLAGWLLDSKQQIDCYLQDGKGRRIATLTEQMRFSRADVAKTYGSGNTSSSAGFKMLLTRSSDESLKGVKLLVKVNSEAGEVSLPVIDSYDACAEPMVNAQRLLNNWSPQNPVHLSKAKLFGPMLNAIFPSDTQAEVKRVDFHQAASNPRATFVIPLYGRFDFLQYQISYFSRMGSYQDCEILYVVDDPSIASKTLKLARKMSVVCDQPFSLLLLSQNVGFGKANNIGVKHAKSDTLVLMNSDVLPKTSDWLQRMMETAQRDDVGIVGARLLYEDESVQHDGMAPMHVNEYPGLFFNDHPRKGWPSDLVPVTQNERSCALLTAACWVLDKSDFESVGGFDSAYVLGDFEDSDLCLKLIEKGKTNYLRRDAQLYHLERQSQNLVQPGQWKHNITVLNAVTFNQRWKPTVEKLYEVAL